MLEMYACWNSHCNVGRRKACVAYSRKHAWHSRYGEGEGDVLFFMEVELLQIVAGLLCVEPG